MSGNAFVPDLGGVNVSKLSRADKLKLAVSKMLRNMPRQWRYGDPYGIRDVEVR